METLLRRISTYEEDKGWLVTAPIQTAEARRTRDDRKVMRQVLLDAADGKLSLDGEAAYIVSKPYGFTANMSLRLASVFDSNLTASGPVPDELAKRTYGLLPAALRKGGQITYGQAPRDLQIALSTAVFGRRLLVSSNYPEEIVSRIINTPLFEEVTNLLPNGISPGQIFDVEVRKALEIKQSYDPSKHNIIHGGDDNIDMVARNRFFEKNPDLITGVRTVPWPDLFQPMESTTYFLKLRFPAHYTPLRVKDQTPVSGPVPYEKLPAAYLKAVDAEIAKLNEMKASGNPPRYIINSGGHRGTPPPY